MLHRRLASRRISSRPPISRFITSAAKLTFGQPLYETRPHLLQPGEVTPGIQAVEYARRRTRLANALPNGSIAVLAAASLKYRSGPVFYPYHQQSDFLYLTGFKEADALAVIEKSRTSNDHVFHLYVRPKDFSIERWEGARSGIQAAQDVFNADEAGSIADISTLTSLITSANQVYVNMSIQELQQLGSPNEKDISPLFPSRTLIDILDERNTSSIRPLMNNLRSVKSEGEIHNMRTAGRISGRAISKAMARSFQTEKELAAWIGYQFTMGGCDDIAYVPVVAGGENALCIHYVRNDDVLRDDELILMDAGGLYGDYIVDITRCWPARGTFSPAQRDLYEMVLTVQRHCVSLCRQDAKLSLDDLHRIAEQQLQDGARRLGLNASDKNMEDLFPHLLGHYIGMDVHDTPGYSRSNPLECGNCVAIEPAIYIPNDDRWPKDFRGLAVRIEDSVCVREDGPYVLTTEAVKEIVDIESLASQRGAERD